MNILIAGDSFASDWSLKYPDRIGWPNILASHYIVTNTAQAGVSEYKILKQLELVDLSQFDTVIVSHTCFSRVHTIKHPFLSNDPLHFNCDLLISDVHQKKNMNDAMKAAWGYFKYHWDETYYRDLYSMFRKEINLLLLDVPKVLQINNFEPLKSDISYRHLLEDYSGDTNHFSTEGNLRIFKDVLNHLRS
jgi:hypothetical protein